MAEMIARFKPGQNVPAFCTAVVRAGRFVVISGAKTAQGDYSVAEAGAGVQTFGVAERDSGPTTDPASSWTRRINVVRPGAIARVVAGAAVAAGAMVQSDSQGRAVTYVPPNSTASGSPIPTTPVPLGQVVGDASAAAGDILEIALF